METTVPWAVEPGSPSPSRQGRGVYSGDLQSSNPEKQKWKVGKQQADGKLQFHHLITQHVCDFQVPIFVSSRSITGHKWFPKWAAQGSSCVNPFSTAFPLSDCSEHSEPKRMGWDPPTTKLGVTGGGSEAKPAWHYRWCLHPRFAMYPLCDLGPVTSPLWALSLFTPQGCCEAPH